MPYQVLEGTRNGPAKPCSHHYFQVDRSWNQHTYNSFIEAYNYAQRWLGPFRGISIKLNQPTEYSRYGDTIEIKKRGNW